MFHVATKAVLIQKKVNIYTMIFFFSRMEANDIAFNEHTGTHIDAPAHITMAEGQNWRLSSIPFEHLMGPGVVIDIHHRADNDPDAEVK